jgi:hypothetical protein
VLSHAQCRPVERDAAGAYRPRDPEQSLVYRVPQENLETFLAQQHRNGRHVPRFVERELRGFLDCGVLACGFLRLQCESCKDETLQPFSCYPQRETMRRFAAAEGYKAISDHFMREPV